MEIFNIGGGEFLIIILFALIIFKPEDIYGLMRSLGRYAGKARRMWRSFVVSIESDIDIAEEIKEVQKLGKETQETLKEIGQSSQTIVNEAVDDLNNTSKEAGNALNTSLASTDAALSENLKAGANAANSAGGDNE